MSEPREASPLEQNPAMDWLIDAQVFEAKRWFVLFHRLMRFVFRGLFGFWLVGATAYAVALAFVFFASPSKQSALLSAGWGLAYAFFVLRAFRGIKQATRVERLTVSRSGLAFDRGTDGGLDEVPWASIQNIIWSRASRPWPGLASAHGGLMIVTERRSYVVMSDVFAQPAEVGATIRSAAPNGLVRPGPPFLWSRALKPARRTAHQKPWAKLVQVAVDDMRARLNVFSAATRVNLAIALVLSVVSLVLPLQRHPSLLDQAMKLQEAGERTKALALFEEELKADPDDAFALNQAAWLLATAPEATPEQRARGLTYAASAAQESDRLETWDTLVCALAAVGDKEKAIAFAEERGLKDRAETFEADKICDFESVPEALAKRRRATAAKAQGNDKAPRHAAEAPAPAPPKARIETSAR